MDVKTLSAIVGHVSASITLDVYSHVTTDMQKNAAAKLAQLIREMKAEIAMLKAKAKWQTA